MRSEPGSVHDTEPSASVQVAVQTVVPPAVSVNVTFPLGTTRPLPAMVATYVTGWPL